MEHKPRGAKKQKASKMVEDRLSNLPEGLKSHIQRVQKGPICRVCVICYKELTMLSFSAYPRDSSKMCLYDCLFI
ncbi:hypothetical protein O6P43_012191 [Quillaja saponaria]|uniref:Uncharacterized protein n=1 Tax=Quillaja saponaria TaxID=32244 RepID=A0AAD7M1M0_QUISA|nr:hypothetical protein O6P43_012191 [Quillaja saponaria]